MIGVSPTLSKIAQVSFDQMLYANIARKGGFSNQTSEW